MSIITTSEQLQEVVDYYSRFDALAFDVETIGESRLDPRRNEVVWLSMATYGGRTDVIPMGHPNGRLLRVEPGRTPRGNVSKDKRLATSIWSPPPKQLYPGEVFSALKPLLMSDRLKVGHNVKFDAGSVTKYLGETPPGPFFDTGGAAYLINSGHRPIKGYAKPYALGSVLRRELGVTYDKKIGAEVEAHPFKTVAQYSHLDARWTWMLRKPLEAQIKPARLGKLWRLEMDLLEVLLRMEMTGAPIDVQALKALDRDLQAERLARLEAVYHHSGGRHDLNLASPVQLVAFIYGPKSEGGLGLKPKKWTKGGVKTEPQPSTDDEALRSYKSRVPFVRALLDYRDTDKTLSTYVTPYLHGSVVRGKQRPPALVNGRIHASFNQFGTETGRFSSSNPNLQNVPGADTETGRRIRGVFQALPGYKLIVGDESQVELRVIGHFSEDPLLCQQIRNGEDLHQAVADALGITRKGGKALNFAIPFGAGPDKVADMAGVGVRDAERYLEEYAKTYKGVTRWKRRVLSDCRKAKPPHVRTLLGRRRFLPAIHAVSYGPRGHAERQAVNTVIQGSAADLIKIAMVILDRKLQAIPDTHLLLTVHDELVVMTPEEHAEAAAVAMREAMEMDRLSVPLMANITVCDRWSEGK